jgi:hypothetical protein
MPKVDRPVLVRLVRPLDARLLRGSCPACLVAAGEPCLTPAGLPRPGSTLGRLGVHASRARVLPSSLLIEVAAQLSSEVKEQANDDDEE